jgi:UDP-N-acetylmuramoylalanine--D-glutamate ligase
MVPTLRYAGERVVVMGLGKSGLSAAASLRAGGADVQVWDDKAASLAEGKAKGFKVFDGAAMNLQGVRTVVWSPGVPHSFPQPHKLAVKARADNVPLACDVDLLVEAQSDAAVVAITGTNGKSTTTSLTAHLFKHAGRKTAVGGNLGIPALDLEPLGFGGTYVLELSSYQLELMPHLACETAVLLNITPDHLDRHGGMDGYIAAKRRIFAGQRYPRTAIIGIDDVPSAALCEALRRDGLHRVVPISARQPVAGGVYVENGLLMDATGTRTAQIFDLRGAPTLPGVHNWQNAAAAAAAALAHGISPSQIVGGLKTFPGLNHRQELVGTVDNVTFINDSKATNADAAEKALLCYDNMYWIAGGQAKEGGIASLKPLFPRIRHAFLIGDAADDFADTLEGHVPFTLYEDMETAIEEAGDMALKDKHAGATVLLSPACASFDMFKNFEERGDIFRATVLEIWPQAKRAHT